MSSIRWIRNVLVDGKPMTMEIMIGQDHIADKSYVRLNQDPEVYFKSEADTRDAIVNKGLEILKANLSGKEITHPNGTPFNWDNP